MNQATQNDEYTIGTLSSTLAGMYVADKRHATEANAKRKDRTAQFLKALVDAAPDLGSEDIKAEVADYRAKILAAGMGRNSAASRASDFRVLLTHYQMVDVTASSIQKQAQAIRDSFKTLVERKSEAYRAAMDKAEAANKALEIAKSEYDEAVALSESGRIGQVIQLSEREAA